MKGINALDYSKSRPDERMKGIAPVVVALKRCPAAACRLPYSPHPLPGGEDCLLLGLPVR